VARFYPARSWENPAAPVDQFVTAVLTCTHLYSPDGGEQNGAFCSRAIGRNPKFGAKIETAALTNDIARIAWTVIAKIETYRRRWRNRHRAAWLR